MLHLDDLPHHLTYHYHPHLKPATSLTGFDQRSTPIRPLSQRFLISIQSSQYRHIDFLNLLIIHYSQSIFHFNPSPASFVPDPSQGLLSLQPCKSDPSISTSDAVTFSNRTFSYGFYNHARSKDSGNHIIPSSL